MAEAKTKQTEVETKQTEVETKQTENDPRRMVPVELWFDKHNKSRGLYVNVNNHNFFIPTGKQVEVPYYIAAVIENSVKQDRNTARLIATLGESGERAAKI